MIHAALGYWAVPWSEMGTGPDWRTRLCNSSFDHDVEPALQRMPRTLRRGVALHHRRRAQPRHRKRRGRPHGISPWHACRVIGCGPQPGAGRLVDQGAAARASGRLARRDAFAEPVCVRLARRGAYWLRAKSRRSNIAYVRGRSHAPPSKRRAEPEPLATSPGNQRAVRDR